MSSYTKEELRACLLDIDASGPSAPKSAVYERIDSSPYIPLECVRYSLDGHEIRWDFTRSMDSVACLLYHREFDSFILVRQFRANVYTNDGEGSSLELCAGLVDKGIDALDTTIEEVKEECGYEIARGECHLIGRFHSSLGINTSCISIFYAIIDEGMHVSKGGGVDKENIQVISLPRARAYALNASTLEALKVYSTSLYLALLYFEKHEKEILKGGKDASK